METTEIKPTEGNVPGKNKIEVTNPKQKKVLMTAGIAAAVIGVAAGAYALGNTEGDAGDNADSETLATLAADEPVVIYTDAPLATTVTDDMSFGEAFAAARAELGPGGFFVWNGSAYNTYMSDEWAAMSPADRQQFMASVDMPVVQTDTDNIAGEIPEQEDASSTNTADSQTVDNVGNNPPATPENQPSSGATPVNNTEQTPATDEAEQVVVEQYAEIDIDGDGVIDGLALDSDGDGLVDAILVDSDGNSVPDILVVDTDDISGLDTMIVDSLETGDPEQMEVYELGEQVEISLPEDIVEAEPADGHIQAAGYSEPVYDEPLPDIDNIADLSDFDDPSLLA